MPMAALVLIPETPVEERVARLEANVEHTRADVADIKIDLRRLNDKVDGAEQRLIGKTDGIDQKLIAKIDGFEQRLTGKIEDFEQRLTGKLEGLDQKLTAKIDGFEQRLTFRVDGVEQRLTVFAMATEKSFAELKIGRALDRVWWFLMSGALLGIMARAFKWL